MRRYFSLLEVLLALVFITLSLPLLIAPFFYGAVGEREAVENMEIAKASHRVFANLLADLHLGKIPLSSLKENSVYPIEDEKVRGNYQFKMEREKEGNVALWKVTFELKTPWSQTSHLFTYEFVAISGALKEQTGGVP